MDPPMLVEVSHLNKALATLLTDIGTLPAVEHHVFSESACRLEGLPTLVAAVELVS